MSVQLVVAHGGISMHKKHPAVWTNFVQQVSLLKINQAKGLLESYQLVDQALEPHNGRILRGNTTGVVFEFDTQEDLTHFVLTWS